MNFDYINPNTIDLRLFIIIFVIAIVALILTRKLLKLSFPYFFMGMTGIILGFFVGSLISAPFRNLPGDYGRWLPGIINIFVMVGILDLFLARVKSVSNFFGKLFSKIMKTNENITQNIIVDTSALIDGRIEAIVETGFLFGKLIIPRFVLEELQSVADSHDSLKRTRGRRGLDVLSRLQKNNRVIVEIIDEETKTSKKVDYQIILLAKAKNAEILSVDYNLNKVASIEGLTVLNINELAESLKPLIIPGEQMEVKIIQKGKEKNQGVGYLPDGTMIVVEHGGNLVGNSVKCEVVRIFHTLAGKMIFVESVDKAKK